MKLEKITKILMMAILLTVSLYIGCYSNATNPTVPVTGVSLNPTSISE